MAKIRFEGVSSTSYTTLVRFEVHVPDADMADIAARLETILRPKEDR